ncbi:MAG: DNA-directed RNA polymerase subunit beta' [Patescibacteria group bacterium]|nr:DNA-directed RNA polymerase subunit beta' [Patescibacteria group bacterium]MDZ4228791.1 DNA-directed RNA polymerase subunit beta' [Patescibacteria group bacterium]
MNKLTDFTSLQIKLASPEVIKSWSHGEVLKPETINYRTLKPEKDGLFCERIFGPTKDWECYCGKYKRIRYRGIICDKCGVEVTQSRVRRERMGHINLASPVTHIWFFKGSPSHLSLLLGISPRNLSGVIYFAKYLVISVDAGVKKDVFKNLDDQFNAKIKELEATTKTDIAETQAKGKVTIAETKKKIKAKEQLELAVNEIELKTKKAISTIRETLASEKDTAKEVFAAVKDLVKRTQPLTVLSEEEYIKLLDYDAADFLKVGMGAEAILEVIKQLDLTKLATRYREEIQKYSGQRQIKAIKVLRIIDAFTRVSIDPSWMVTTTLPVLPPDLRPMVQLSGGHFASSDINDLYRRVINRNNRLKHLMNLGAPEIILRNEKRMLQEAVDTLIDTSQARAVRRRGAKELRSLADMLRGKQGRFRQNLLGKRVDYSGRSVIVVGPDLKLNQCGLPKIMALEIFKPYVLRELINRGFAPNVKSAKHVLERRPAEVFDILEDIIKDHPVLLNRAPTLHKLGIQAFYPVLVEGSAIQIHPCVCAGYNADFDGDQMAVHVPLSKDSIREAKEYMMPNSNLLKPADGSPITIPNKEMALGIYYLTSIDTTLQPSETIFSSQEEAIMSWQTKAFSLRQPVKVRLNEIIDTTVGRLLFNQALPKALQFINDEVNASGIKSLMKKALKLCSREETVKLIDDLKSLGFVVATNSGISVAVTDCKIIDNKDKLISEANKKAALIEENYKNGLITMDEKRRLSNELWMDTTDIIAQATWNNFESNNAVKTIINSGGTRASKDQVKQLAAMRGLVVDPLGKIVELPTKSNFREGLSIFEYVTSARGSRKGLTDSAIKTADAGYLTRRLVDVAHDMIIRLEDCGTKNSLLLTNAGTRQKSFATRIVGRFLAEKIINPKTKKVLLKKGALIEEELAEKIVNAKVSQVFVRSPLTCQARYGLCAQCYGWDFSTKKPVTIGAPVGVIAAQSIGEPGTQLTMRVKHFGGIVVSDVTQGLPRVEELFEARTPKLAAPLAEIPGKIKIKETNQGYQLTITPVGSKGQMRTYLVPLTAILKVKNNELVAVGDHLSTGPLNVKNLLGTIGILRAQEYLIEEIQAVYESQGIPIHDKHFEVIVRKMSDKVQVDSVGDTKLLIGEFVELPKFEEANTLAKKEHGKPATSRQVMLGITRSALYTESWLSAASFQHTSSVLTEAAAEGKIDKLLGLKENVIIGRLIPTNAERAGME